MQESFPILTRLIFISYIVFLNEGEYYYNRWTCIPLWCADMDVRMEEQNTHHRTMPSGYVGRMPGEAKGSHRISAPQPSEMATWPKTETSVK